jgi:ATP-binding cassette subfamily B multidrug efflux pump
MEKGKTRHRLDPRLLAYFSKEKKTLAVVTVTGLIYNIGMIAGPWFEGQLAQYLKDTLSGSRTAGAIARLSLAYVLTIALVQFNRFLKRLYVRKFANNTTRRLKEEIYHHLMLESTEELRREDTGALMTKAVADAEALAEGMRKFTTEIFDTGVVMIAYVVMLLVLDFRLALISMIFPPFAYFTAGKIKGYVTGAAAGSRKSLSRLSAATVDRVSNALTYRIYGEEPGREAAYEEALGDYERKNIAAGIWQNSTEPLYLTISMVSVIPIFWFGGRNVTGGGWTSWSIAAFSTFLACFLKLATKSSHAAKLFNAIHKAEVSWERIQSYLGDTREIPRLSPAAPEKLTVSHVSLSFDGRDVLKDISFAAAPGQIIGITGTVASGKSSLGRLFLNEDAWTGEILYGGKDIRKQQQSQIFAYSGHDPELFAGTAAENVTFGAWDEKRFARVLSDVRLDREFTADSRVGEKGAGVSGGQAGRLSLARALYSPAPVLVLDDPFAAVDAKTEAEIFAALRRDAKNRIILFISHRLAMFPHTDAVLMLEKGRLIAGTHEELLSGCPSYAKLFALQEGEGGTGHEEQ